MNERQAHSVVLVRALEESDPDRLLWTASEREETTRAAFGQAGDDEARLVSRAERLLGLLEGRLPVSRWPCRPLPWGWILAAAGVTAFASGMATDTLAPGAPRRIHLLFHPLHGLLAWNLGVYVFLAWAARRGRRAGGLQGAAARGLAGLRVAAGAWVRRQGVSAGGAPPPGGGSWRVLTEALPRHLMLWGPVGAPLAAARTRAALHLAAGALAAGCVAGLYWRGLVREYQVYWESTFLDASAVRALLGTLLGPVAAFTGRTLPDVEAIEGLRAGGPAAEWIHLYALAAGVYVLVPRALLFAPEARRARRLADHLPVDLGEPSYRRVLAAGRGADDRVIVRPFAWQPAPRQADVLRGALQDHLGHHAHIEFTAPVPHSARPGPDTPAGATDVAPTVTVALFSLGQTPEDEVHGAFLARLSGGDGEAARLLVVVDGTHLRGGTGPDSLRERRRQWDGFVARRGLGAAHVDLDAGAGEAVAAALAAAEGPPHGAARGGDGA
ncbi:MAG: DUF2868 domain-containing protein [Planctomycetes bacterium]|nr:DUF2868 domain-containing protein [Planctomycetota bacterium]